MNKKEDQPTEQAQPEPKEITAQEAVLTLERQRQQRIDNCRQDIQRALQAYNCDLDVSVVLRGGSVEPRVDVVARD